MLLKLKINTDNAKIVHIESDAIIIEFDKSSSYHDQHMLTAATYKTNLEDTPADERRTTSIAKFLYVGRNGACRLSRGW